MDIICPICQNVLSEPRGLLCNHAVCSGCLKQHVEDNFYIHNGQCGVSCPACQTFNPAYDANKPISTWSDDFPLLEDVANEINELKLCTIAVVPALRHNLNVWYHRNMKPVPLFSLSHVNPDYTFTSAWPGRQYQFLLQHEWQPRLYIPRQLPRAGRFSGSYKQPNTNVNTLGIFTSVIPKIKHLIASSELGSKAIDFGQDVYDSVMSKISFDEDNSVVAPAVSAASFEDLVSGHELMEVSDSEETSGKILRTEPTKVDQVENVGSTVPNSEEVASGNVEYPGPSSSVAQNSNQEYTYVHTERKTVKEEISPAPNVKIENTYNYYTTHIHHYGKSELVSPENTMVSPESTTASPETMTVTQSTQGPISTQSVIVEGTEKQTVNFFNGKLFDQPLQAPVWAIPQRPAKDLQVTGNMTSKIFARLQGFTSLLRDTKNSQVVRYKDMLHKFNDCETDGSCVSKRAYTWYKNQQEKIKYGPHWRRHTSKGRRFQSRKSLTGESSGDSSCLPTYLKLMSYDKSSREK